jgi:hypothetical protein
VPILSKKKEQGQQQTKRGYWQDELDSLGIETKEKIDLNDDEELQNLAENIKQAMFQDYKVAYSEKGDQHKEEAQSTVKLDDPIKKPIFFLPSSDSSNFQLRSNKRVMYRQFAGWHFQVKSVLVPPSPLCYHYKNNFAADK